MAGTTKSEQNVRIIMQLDHSDPERVLASMISDNFQPRHAIKELLKTSKLIISLL
jgi:hypothetical protein